MASSLSHPAASSSEEALADRVARISLLLGLLGPLGFLEAFQHVHSIFEIAELFYIFFLFFLVPPALTVLSGIWSGVRSLHRRLTGTAQGSASVYEADDPRSWIQMGYKASPLKTLQVVALVVHPNTVIRGLFQMAGAVVAYVRHGGRLPRPETFESTVEYRPPFDGEWTVVNGSPDKRYSHSWFPVRQRYAYDFVVTDDDGATHDGSGGLESFYCFDEPILAPADGTVVRAKDGHRDHHRTTGWVDPLQYRLAGNYVVIEHAEDEYSFLAHLKRGSVCVEPGEDVTRGQVIGRCGHSGNSSEPHLHFHVQDHRIPYVGAGLPITFDAATNHPELSSAERTQTYVHCGQTIAYDTNSE
ncbi:M23 family metallopeptidase [Halobacterium bonnevillei]|uniref:Peptidoglycan DD-metalloendopeptidase family protein n=1 Tax=Halobacterium bonnevillei TaxID=2692200 RepID=A0A6B0SKZ2_9EURY|nr:M23 family metallopeptidase [Halobacterium bonnevillei]MXR21897.1 peptidoglycan DD-metalloendopeptidase family protein [Halobacterium bonnevillei]